LELQLQSKGSKDEKKKTRKMVVGEKSGERA